jgi:hypothetical protein
MKKYSLKKSNRYQELNSNGCWYVIFNIFLFKSYWAEESFTYIESHTWTERQGPENTPRTISVYNNCESVEFFHNGQSLGVKQNDITKFPVSGLTWDINFKSGKNTLKAVGFPKDDKRFQILWKSITGMLKMVQQKI